MKRRTALSLIAYSILFLAMISCSSGGSGSGSGGGGSNTPPPAQTDTQKLVGTWNFVSSSDYILGQLIFKADGTGIFSGTGFSAGRVDNVVFYFTLDSGQNEAFDIVWSNNNNTITLTNHNGGSWYTYNRA